MTDEPSTLPPGEYAIVEVLGHRTLIGRVSEVDRFGTKLMSIEPLYNGELLAAVLIGGSSIYQFTPCTADVASAHSPKKPWQLPSSIAALLPLDALPAPEPEEDDLAEPDQFPEWLTRDDDEGAHHAQ